MFGLLDYYAQKFRYPHAADFLSMGLGIEARLKRCRREWAPHLALSREFIAGALKDLPVGGRIAVLGAGRLFDVPIEALREHAAEVHLFDADPGCLRGWRALPHMGGKVIPHLGDLTGTLERWTAELRGVLKRGAPSLEKTTELLESFTCGKGITPERFDLVVSVNLLSQIPIYWRDRVETLLNRVDRTWFAAESLHAVLEGTYRTLQRAHLEMLEQTHAPRIVVITDERFFYYRSDLAPWQEEPSLYIPALELEGYSRQRTDGWLWHIIPQGIEAREYGSIHEVRAMEFARRAG